MRKLLFLGVFATLSLLADGKHLAQEELDNYFQTTTVTTDSGTPLEKIIISGPPHPPAGFTRNTVNAADLEKKSTTAKVLTTPAFSWSFGCAPTAAAMLAGYYDRHGFPNVYRGPTNNGLIPMDNSVWGTMTDAGGDVRDRCPLSATQKGLDGRTTRGHVDDYWVTYDDNGDDPYVNNWTEHTYSDCTADFMKTNQTTKYGNSDGATTFYFYNDGSPLTAKAMESYDIQDKDGAYGLKRFFESRGYQVTELYTQKIDTAASGGFTFNQYKAEIDAGHPVLIHVTGHMMTGVGYDASNNTIYLHDTWDYNTHSMTWGGSYSGMDQYGVTVIHLKPQTSPTQTIPQPYVIPLPNNKAVSIVL